MLIYQDHNYDYELTVRVWQRKDGGYAVQLFDGLDPVNNDEVLMYHRFVSVLVFDASCRREAVERARRIVIGKPLPGETIPV